mmetsp:Transcript_6217/g.38619  ORF Transcript_6217/g.38619 Transcript_6217/m.38619 type:complete len:123 (+) Transcript_6217:480-848(+)
MSLHALPHRRQRLRGQRSRHHHGRNRGIHAGHVTGGQTFRIKRRNGNAFSVDFRLRYKPRGVMLQVQLLCVNEMSVALGKGTPDPFFVKGKDTQETRLCNGSFIPLFILMYFPTGNHVMAVP